VTAWLAPFNAEPEIQEYAFPAGAATDATGYRSCTFGVGDTPLFPARNGARWNWYSSCRGVRFQTVLGKSLSALHLLKAIVLRATAEAVGDK